jgi:hypothetical protein
MGENQNIQFTLNSLIVSDLPLISNLIKLNTMELELTIIIENVHTMSDALDININPLNL